MFCVPRLMQITKMEENFPKKGSKTYEMKLVADAGFRRCYHFCLKVAFPPPNV